MRQSTADAPCIYLMLCMRASVCAFEVFLCDPEHNLEQLGGRYSRRTTGQHVAEPHSIDDLPRLTCRIVDTVTA